LTLINELLEFTRNELQPLEVNPTRVSMKLLMDDIAQFAVALSAQQDNKFQYEARTSLPAMVLLDGRRVQQVLLNLLANAAKFTRHGTIAMVITATRQTDRWALHFIVADTGIGMAQEVQSHVFNAFTQAQPHQGGVGLGLFIARQIVETMGGELKVESAPGIGSRFSFEIMVDSVDDAAAVISSTTATKPGGIDPPALIEPHTAALGQPPLNSDRPWSYPIPPAHTRVELAIHARDGQLTDIEEWLRRTVAAYPAFPDFFNEVKAALDTLDFEYIEALALTSDT
jgi:anti-sigma regulatory factor (Ser/Thr protein kinase)